MIDLIVKGGICMYPIILCSILALAILLERLWVLRRRSILPADFLHKVEDLLRNRKIAEAVFLSQGEPSPIGKILHAGLKNAGRGMWLVKEAIEERGGREALALEKHVGILSTLANLVTLLGLLGTVTGMIKCFNVISVEGLGNPGSFASGMYEALITTVAGLTVAIPTFLGQRYLSHRAESFIHALEEYTAHLYTLITRASAK